MGRTLWAGALYFASVFAAGFALGALRVLVVIPRLGELLAVLMELPVMLAICWALAGWVIRLLAVPPDGRSRLIMGGLAFALLMLAEAVLAIWGFGRGLAGYLAHYATLPGVLGLVGQGVFALIPWLRRSEG